MDALFFHPKIVHLPIALGLLMPLLASGLVLAWWRQWLPSRVWVIAIGFQAVLLLSGVMALRSGEAEEERVERVVAERFIEEHEESAEAFVWASGIVLGVMLLSLVMIRQRAGLPLAALASVGTLIVFGLGFQTGQAGGALVYEHGAASAYESQGD
jgi:hypothetical protein